MAKYRAAKRGDAMIVGTARLLESTANQPREVWLEHRKWGIGASEVPAILGVDRYAGPWTVAARKLGLVPESEESIALRWGVHQEPFVLAETARELGVEIVKVPWVLGAADQTLPLRVNLDGWVPSLGRPVEAKAPFRAVDHEGWESLVNDGVPAEGTPAESYWFQLQAQMLVTGSEAGYIAKLASWELFVAEVEANAAVHALIIDRVREVWSAVEQVRREPGLRDYFLNGGIIEPNAADCGEFQTRAKPGVEAGEINDPSVSAAVSRLRILSAEVETREAEVEQLKVKLVAAMTSNGFDRAVAGDYALKLRSTKRASGEYTADVDKASLAELRAAQAKAKELTERLKKWAVYNQSLRVEATLRGER